jgi:transglycosylase-like protein with SLT domain
MAFSVPAVDPAAQRVGRFNAQPTVMAAMRDASAGDGTKFDMLAAYAAMESGFNPGAKAATSSASGLYQFTQQTWLNAVREYGAAHGLGTEAAAVVRQGGQLTVDDPAMFQRIMELRNDPKASSDLAVEHLNGLTEQLSSVLGRAPDPSEVYLAHFLGGAGATQVVQALRSSPNRPAAELLPAAAAANKPLFYNADGTAMTVTQFMQNLRDRVSRTYASLGTTMPAAAPITSSGAKPDPAEAEASGWGTTTPSSRISDQQRTMLATMAEVFTRMDHSARHDRRQHGLPEAVVSALANGT